MAGEGLSVADTLTRLATLATLSPLGVPWAGEGLTGENAMKIASFHSQILNVPEDEPLAGALEKEGAVRPIVILTLATDDGIEGIGVSFYGGALSRTLKSAIDQLCELCVGEDPHRVEAIIKKLRDAAGGPRPGGLVPPALAP